MEKIIFLVPIGEVNQEILEFLKEKLTSIFPYSFEIYKNINIPEKSFNNKRRQYLSSIFLDEISKINLPSALKILGVTNVDLYVPNLNFIFGQAKIKGREAIISLARLNNTFYGLKEDIEILKKRALKEAVHELGHTFGLFHCPNSKCVMYFSNTLRDTDNKDYNFCNYCYSIISTSFTL